MSSFKYKTPARSASKDQFGRIQPEEKRSRYYWRFIPGSKAALELAYGEEDDSDFLPAPVVEHMRRKART